MVYIAKFQSPGALVLDGLNCGYPLFSVPSPGVWAFSASPGAEIWNRTRDLVFKRPQNKVFWGTDFKEISAFDVFLSVEAFWLDDRWTQKPLFAVSCTNGWVVHVWVILGVGGMVLGAPISRYFP